VGKKDRVPEAASDVNDKETLSKAAADLEKQLKQLFFENKQIHTNVVKAEKEYLKSGQNLDAVMKDKKLVRVAGRIEVAREGTTKMQRMLKNSDIPDYDKIH